MTDWGRRPWGRPGPPLISPKQTLEREELLYLLCHLPHGLDTRSIQVVVVLAGFNEPVILDIFLHLFSGRNKVVIPTVHLVVSLWPGRIFVERDRQLSDRQAGPTHRNFNVDAKYWH